MKKSRMLMFVTAGALLCAGGLWAQTMKRGLKVTVKQSDPPKLSVRLTPSNGGPSRYDFENGTSECVVRFATGRQCTLEWSATDADRIEITPAQWYDSGKDFAFPAPVPSREGSFVFYNYQFAAGTIRHFTIKATNAAGTTEHRFTIRRYSCFLPGTQVLMADGTYKNVEDVKAGDRVMSYDTKTGKVVAKSVVARTERVEKDGYYVVNKDLKVTPNHLFYGNGEWTKTKDLKVGDSLLNPNGEPVPITSLERVEKEVTVYNLITEDPEDYFVRMASQDVLVHNQGRTPVPEKGFAAGTTVVLADGRYVPIEKVKVGDRLLSYDKTARRYVIVRVRGASNQRLQRYVVINGSLALGPEHPVYSVDPKSAPDLPD